VVLQTLTVAAFQVSPLSHFSHFGIPKFNTALLELQLLFTVALHQGCKVDVVPTLTVAALPVSHFSPFGIQKFNTAF
jgi:hypothetical protein